MEVGLVYIGECPYTVDFGTRRLVRLDVEGQLLDFDKARTRGDYYTLALDRSSRLPVEQFKSWKEASKT
ncbi:hypothetical protein D3C87_600280 [compost metagenome]